MTLPVTVCVACGAAVFPRRVLCPYCGAREWIAGRAEFGTVEQVAEVNGTAVVTVRTDIGPTVVARTCEALAAGQLVEFADSDSPPIVALQSQSATAQLFGLGEKRK